MLGEDSLTSFLPGLSREPPKSSLSQEMSGYTLLAATPPEGTRAVCCSHPHPGKLQQLAWPLGKGQEG